LLSFENERGQANNYKWAPLTTAIARCYNGQTMRTKRLVVSERVFGAKPNDWKRTRDIKQESKRAKEIRQGVRRMRIRTGKQFHFPGMALFSFTDVGVSYFSCSDTVEVFFHILFALKKRRPFIIRPWRKRKHARKDFNRLSFFCFLVRSSSHSFANRLLKSSSSLS